MIRKSHKLANCASYSFWFCQEPTDKRWQNTVLQNSSLEGISLGIAYKNPQGKLFEGDQILNNCKCHKSEEVNSHSGHSNHQMKENGYYEPQNSSNEQKQRSRSNLTSRYNYACSIMINIRTQITQLKILLWCQGLEYRNLFKLFIIIYHMDFRLNKFMKLPDYLFLMSSTS